MIVTTWAAYMRAAGLSTRTIVERERAVRGLCAHAGRPPAELRPVDVVAWLGRDGLSIASRATYYGHVAAFAQWAAGIGLVEGLVDGVPVPRRRRGAPRPVTDAELQRILAACTHERTRDYVRLAAFAGLRVHEVAKLRGEDVHGDVEGYVLDVVGKGGQLARIPLSDELRPLVERRPRRGWWFPSSSTSGHVLGSTVSRAISGAMQRAGVHATPHALRHWYGSTLLAQCGNLRVVQTLMRHESPT
ncbi:MAG: site-specific integrase, partial [Microbacteriaceae bacterium]|nr:site-specific integrase [Microbacteriaceae bacterium]